MLVNARNSQQAEERVKAFKGGENGRARAVMEEKGSVTQPLKFCERKNE